MTRHSMKNYRVLYSLEGASVEVGPGVTVSQQHLHKVIQGEELGNPSELFYWDPQYFSCWRAIFKTL